VVGGLVEVGNEGNKIFLAEQVAQSHGPMSMRPYRTASRAAGDNFQRHRIANHPWGHSKVFDARRKEVGNGKVFREGGATRLGHHDARKRRIGFSPMIAAPSAAAAWAK